MRSFSVEERRARLGRRHGLTTKLSSTTELTEAMVVLHASDPATIFLSALARMANPSLAAVEAALYEDRSVVRVLAMRRTLFVVPVSYLAVIEQSSAPSVAAAERKKLLGYLADSGIDDPAAWLAAAMAEIEAALSDPALASQGSSARQLTARVPRLAAKLVLGAGSTYEVTAGATSRVLGVLAAEGRLVRGRPAGNWTTRQYQWHLRHQWLGQSGEGQERALTPSLASAELVRRWLRAFGPATFDDLRWWTGWTVRQVREALALVAVAEVDLNGGDGLALADELDPEPPTEPWVALLPSLDPTAMGWKQRDWYLGPHQGPLFDRSGNIGPTVWVDGRIVGAWSQRRDRSIAVGLLEDVGSDYGALIEAEAENLEQLLGATVVKPAFPTPLQRELSA
jgi:hypothetical protein